MRQTLQPAFKQAAPTESVAWQEHDGHEIPNVSCGLPGESAQLARIP